MKEYGDYYVSSVTYQHKLDKKYRKDNGIFYTDLELADSIIKFLEIPKSATIIDPCCGMGVFLYLLKSYGYENIFGYERDY